VTSTKPTELESTFRRRIALGFLAVLAAALAMHLPGGSAGAQPAAPGGPELKAADRGDTLTPVLQSVKSTPRWYPADDGKLHLQYELILTNATQVPVDVVSLDVLSGAGGSISSLSGSRLDAAMGFAAGATARLEARSVGIVFMDLTFPNRDALPRRVKHRVTVSSPDSAFEPITDTSSKVRVEPRGPLEISAPLRGPDWVAVVGPHRRAILPVNGSLRVAQRFAIDFSAKLDDQDRTHLGPADENESYFVYGEPVIAVAPGKVVAAVDRYPDKVPNEPGPIDLPKASGNHVVLKLQDGVFAGYGHLKPGSVRVEAGDRVREGQVLGRLGNSGNSSGPHLHFQLMSRGSFLDADGLPFTLDRFRLLGRVPSLEALIDNDLSGDPVPLDRSVAGRHRHTGLTDLDVVSFPGG
jgi:hypothetical protein